MVRAVATAAGGQGSVVSIKGDRKRSQGEENDEQDGESAPHLGIMLHELWSNRRFGEACGLQVSSFHLDPET